jgi:glucose-1-phosphate cytidylyltransferase
MKVVLLAGGLGTRISEETDSRPKPMVEIGGKPILWHIMKLYSHYGLNDFVICLGYKGYVIKEYFANYSRHMSDVTYDLLDHSVKIHNNYAEPWKITLIDTGETSMTGGRIKLIKDYIDEDTFCMTYGDGLSDIDIKELIKYHKTHKKYATMTAVQPPGRFGAIEMGKDGLVSKFLEKPSGDGAYINGGFFVLQKDIFDYIEGSDTVWEKAPLENLTRDNQLMAYQYNGFWQPMDTLRDKNYLENLWLSRKAPWCLWEQERRSNHDQKQL